MGVTGYSRRNLGLDSSAKNVISPVNIGGILKRPPRFEIRADNRRFHNVFASLVAALEHKDFAKVIGIFFRDALSVWVGFRALFFEMGALSACLAFFDTCGFPLG